MKILYITPTYNSYSEVWQQRHISMLQDHIFCIAAILPNENMWNDKIPIVDLKPDSKLKNKIKKISGKKLNNEKDINKSLTKLIKKADIIFVQYLTFAARIIDSLNKTSKPIFIHTHGFDITWDLRSHQNPNIKVHKSKYLKTLKKFKSNVTFIANSKDTIAKLEIGGLKTEQIRLKYLGTDIYPDTKLDKDDKKEINLLYIGRLVDFKGPDMVIEAFNKSCDAGVKATLTIAGDGQLRAMCELLKRKSKYSKKIELLGSVSKEKADELRTEADIFIAHNCKGLLSGQEEAFGVSIIEAMEAKLVIINSASAGIKETVIHNITGLLNKPFDIEEQAKNIELLYNNRTLLEKMGQEGRKRVIAEFSFDIEKDNFLRILKGTS